MRFSSKEEMLAFAEAKKNELVSLGMDLGKWVQAGIPVVSQNLFESRIAICKGCEFWNQSGFSGTGSCKKCGCSTQAKLRLGTSKCPIEKWTEE